jgi:AcrR family transcriptional regulator
MGIAERRQRQKEEVRTAILRAAWQLVNTEGWASLSIRKIADAIEYSVPVIYDHFENKDAILHEFMKQGFVLLAENLQKAKDTATDPAAQLGAIGKAYWDFAFGHKAYYQIMFGVGVISCEMVKQTPEIQKYADVIYTTIKDLIAQSGSGHIDPMLKYHSFWSTLHGLVSVNLMGMSTAPPAMTQLVLNDVLCNFVKALKE